MKQYFFINFMAITIIASFSLSSCDSSKSNEEKILGKWNAHWETKPDDSFPDLKGENLKMDGVIEFTDDGKVEISAYGFDGCIFSDDTLTNTMSWKLDETVLRFIDKGDEHGLPYNIVKLTSRKLELTLLEDINLTLSRN